MQISTQSSDAYRDEFMTLLVAQLKNQDPLEPVQQQDFLSQLAQFSTLESMENLTDRFDSLLKVQELSYGAGLVGKSVLFENVQGEQLGRVDAIHAEGSSFWLEVSGNRVELDEIKSVAN